jgi:hypothetical protein
MQTAVAVESEALMRLGQSTLTLEERITEAKRHIATLKPHFAEMTDKDLAFVQSIDDSLLRYGAKASISPNQIFWLRDLILKY